MAGLAGVKMSGNGNSNIIAVNPVVNLGAPYSYAPSWGLGIVCTLSSGGSLTYSVQVTCDPQPSVGGNWNNHDTIASQTGSVNGNVAFPITGLRLSVTNYVSGSVNLGVCQWP